MDEQDRQLEEIEAQEAWLAGFKTPGPSAEAVNRAKLAARRELALQHGASTARAWKAWHGVLGAAAAIALCVMVGWYAIDRQATTISQVIAENDVQPQWPESTQKETTLLAAMDDDLSDLENWSSEESWGTGGADLYYALQDALQDDSTSQPTRNNATKNGRSQG